LLKKNQPANILPNYAKNIKTYFQNITKRLFCCKKSQNHLLYLVLFTKGGHYMLSDFHLHSHYSADSETLPEDVIETAIKLGMKCICFTEHNDFEFPKNHDNFDFTLDTKAYFNELNTLKEKYSSRIDVRIGLEAGLEICFEDRINNLINNNSFDFVIGSSHLINRLDPYYPEFFENRTEKECFEEYFINILDNVKTFDNFDVYGHLDYIVRYPDTKDKYYSYSAFGDIIDEILRTIIYKGKGIEVNSGGLRCGLTFPNPHPDIIKRYKELGGEILTIGSDAHTTEYIGKYFDRIEDIIKACGFEYYTIFKNRKPEFIKL